MNNLKNNISIFIPARSASKRIPNKNIQPLNSIPLLAYSVLSGMALEPTKTYVSSDSNEYLKIAEKYGAIPLFREKNLCQDDTPMEDVIKDFVTQIECDLVVQLLPTTPFRSIPMLKKSIQTLIEAGENADSLRSVEVMAESAYKCYEIRYGYLTPIISIGYKPLSTQDLHNITYQTFSDMALSNQSNQIFSTTYRANGYVDIFKRDRILSGDPWGRATIPFITPPAIEIDTPEQLRYANYVVSSRGYDVFKFDRR